MPGKHKLIANRHPWHVRCTCRKWKIPKDQSSQYSWDILLSEWETHAQTFWNHGEVW